MVVIHLVITTIVNEMKCLKNNLKIRLKEGFATYYQYFGVKMIESGWDLEEQFVVEGYHNSMMLDSTDNTHPMTDTSVTTKVQSRGIFTLVSYNKAGSVIRMLEHYIGSEKYQLTMRTFLADK